MSITRPDANRVPSTTHSDASSLPHRIEQIHHAITAPELARFLAVSPITVYKLAKAGRLPSFRIGTSVRFDPRAVAEWLRGNAW
jgi:excisionase family DNA binding protein